MSVKTSPRRAALRMRDQIHEALGAEDANFDITEIVAEIESTRGVVDIDTIPVAEFWPLVDRHGI